MKFKIQDGVLVDNPENTHHGKMGVIRAIDETLLHAYTVEFTGQQGGERFREQDLKLLGKAAETRPEMLKDESYNPQAEAVALVGALFYPGVDISEIYIVWYVTALQNWKALVSTNIADDCYYEVTHNGDKNETYVDRYSKEYNVKVSYHEGGKLEDAAVEFNKI